MGTYPTLPSVLIKKYVNNKKPSAHLVPRQYRTSKMATHTPTPPAILPTAGFVRQRTLLLFLPFSGATLWRKIKTGEFPQPVKLGVKITAWRVEDVREYFDTIGGAI
jgi:predicted DNA-binding transcriptional regulator AlpA